MLAMSLKYPFSFTHTPRRASDQDCFIADIGKAQRILGWSPEVSAGDGIEKV